MRARTFVFALICGTATAALAQDGGYVRFPAASPQACAISCAGDQMCASWSYGMAARSYGQSSAAPDGGGMCTFSGSSVVRNSPNFVSGLPRREPVAVAAPIISAPPQQARQRPPPPPPTSSRQSNQNTGGASGWDVRPAPWLSNIDRAPEITQPMQQPGMPQMLRPVPPIPTPTPSAVPRIEYDPPEMQPNTVPQPVYVAPRPPVPVYVPPPAQIAPFRPPPARLPPRPEARPVPSSPLPAPIQPTALNIPDGPPGTQEMRSNEAGAAATLPSSPPRASNARVSAPFPSPRPSVTPTTRRPAAARGTARTTQPTAIVAPTGGAPARQETTARSTTGPNAPRSPVRDPSNPESFRGADGMIDAAEMRRAQLNAAREQGQPAYSVQREWEAVEAERQRAAAAGEVRVDPLAGTSPVPPPPETRAQKRAREAEEAALAAEESRAASPDDEGDVSPSPPVRRPATRGGRGVPRPKAQRQTSDASSRQTPAQALDREPKLSGGPG